MICSTTVECHEKESDLRQNEVEYHEFCKIKYKALSTKFFNKISNRHHYKSNSRTKLCNNSINLVNINQNVSTKFAIKPQNVIKMKHQFYVEKA